MLCRAVRAPYLSSVGPDPAGRSSTRPDPTDDTSPMADVENVPDHAAAELLRSWSGYVESRYGRLRPEYPPRVAPRPLPKPLPKAQSSWMHVHPLVACMVCHENSLYFRMWSCDVASLYFRMWS